MWRIKVSGTANIVQPLSSSPAHHGTTRGSLGERKRAAPRVSRPRGTGDGGRRRHLPCPARGRPPRTEGAPARSHGWLGDGTPSRGCPPARVSPGGPRGRRRSPLRAAGEPRCLRRQSTWAAGSISSYSASNSSAYQRPTNLMAKNISTWPGGLITHCQAEIGAILPIINVLLTKMCFSVCFSAKW